MGTIYWKEPIATFLNNGISLEFPVFEGEPGQFGFVGLRVWNSKYIPIYIPLIYTLEVQEGGELFWTYFKSGKKYKKYGMAADKAKRISLEYGERPFGGGSFYPTIDTCHFKIPYTGEVDLELVAKITKLRGIPCNF